MSAPIVDVTLQDAGGVTLPRVAASDVVPGDVVSVWPGGWGVAETHMQFIEGDRHRVLEVGVFAKGRTVIRVEGARALVQDDDAMLLVARRKPPLELRAVGDVSLLARLQADLVCLTGARAATGYGEHVAMEFAARLAREGYTLVNGGAYGIEGMALRSFMAAGGKPVVVLAGGVDRLYPAGHQALLERVVEVGGLLVSGQPDGTMPTRERFVARQTLLARLCGTVVVVESGNRSGALQVARDAHARGGRVGAVPGPVTSAASHGCHALIGDGTAALVGDSESLVGLIEKGRI